MRGISKSLGLEENYIQKTLDVDVGSQMLVVNLYPPCPTPEVAIGLPPHSDYGLLTLLMQNEAPGLQVMHNGKWVRVNPLPNSFVVITGDHMEVKLPSLCKANFTPLIFLISFSFSFSSLFFFSLSPLLLLLLFLPIFPSSYLVLSSTSSFSLSVLSSSFLSLPYQLPILVFVSNHQNCCIIWLTKRLHPKSSWSLLLVVLVNSQNLF